MIPRPAQSAETALPSDAPAPSAAGAAIGRRGRAGLLRALALLPAFAFLLVVLAPPLNHDVSAVLNFSERWLAGEHLYSDLIDVNPPLIFVLTLIPAALAAWTPLEGPQALLLCVLLLCAFVWRLTVRLRAGRDEGPIEAAALTAAVPMLMLMAGYDFAQREHLMAIAAIPYAILAARRIEGPPVPRGLSLTVAVLAAFGFALKPHFLAVPALVEGFVLLRRGPRRAFTDPVPWLMAGVWLAYLISIPLLFSDYFGYVVPLVWRFYTDLSVFSPFDVLISSILGPAMLMMLGAAAIAFRPRGPALPSVLVMAAAGAFASAWVQHKGWSYHALPIAILSGAAMVAAVARWLDGIVTPVRRVMAAPAIAAVMTACLGIYAARGEAPWRELWFDWDRAGQLTSLLRREAYGERLLVLSPDIFPVYPALNYAHAQSTLRTMNLWLLQGTNATCPANGERYHQTWEMSRAEFFVYRTVAEDFARAPPAAVLVSDNPGIPWCGREFNFVEYFSRHPLFAETWQRYRLGGTVDGYKLYVRED